MLYRISTLFVYCVLKLFFGLTVAGKNAIPRTGPFILASNHLSNFDPPTLAVSCPRRICFLAKEELFSKSLFRFYLRNVGAIPLQRHKSDIKAIRSALNILKQKPLLVFPQGTRGRSLDESLAGVGFLAKKTGVPVVVARILGTDKVLPKGKTMPYFHRLKVAFGRVDNIKSYDSYEQITAKVTTAIKAL